MYISSDKPIEKNTEIAHFEEILAFKSSVHSMQNIERWNERALHWEKSILTKTEDKINTPRIRELISFLKNEGALDKTTSVLDIGGGVGVIASALAKNAKDVLVMDFSSEMCRVGRNLASKKNEQNVDFLEADFFAFDVDKNGFKGKFDLVFSALSPSIKYGGLDKCLSISKKYFANESYVSREVELYTQIEKEVFGVRREDTFDGHWSGFYAMTNLLFLKGYYPKVAYIRESEEHSVLYSDEILTDAMIFLSRTLGIENNDKNRGKVDAYIRKTASKENNKLFIPYNNRTIYGVTLVDVRERDVR